ncbi:MAG: type II toxin-antitoxin system death-on-curing family toxin [Vampirovibrionales bacterium]
MHYNYFDVEHAIQTHHFILKDSDEQKGVKEKGLLESVLEHMKNDEYYPDFLDKITHLVFGINKNHPFHNGNKRASVALSALFLELNGFDDTLKQYQHGMEEPTVWLASSLLERDTLRKIIRYVLCEDAFHVAVFIQEAKRFAPLIVPPEPEKGCISNELLKQMVDDWFSIEMCLSDATKFAIMQAVGERQRMQT